MASPVRSPSGAVNSYLTQTPTTTGLSSATATSPYSGSAASPRSPTKSIRSDSFPADDGGGGSAGGSPTPAPRATRRARNLLKNYYGIVESEAGGGSGTPGDPGSMAASQDNLGPANTIKPWGADPMDMDSEAFISETFINSCLYQKNLNALIRTDTELIEDVRRIDGQMKTLVYQNYHKFIAATDTIKQMRTKVEGMNDEMGDLERKMNALVESNNKLNDMLNPNRTKLQKLHSVNALLRKLNFVFELPAKLEAAFSCGHFKQAVRYHVATSALLQHYYHIPVFQKIDEECKEITVKVGIKVREKMKSSSSSISEIREALGLLLGLNMQFPTELARDYLKTVKEKMTVILEEATKQLDAASKNLPPSAAEPASKSTSTPTSTAPPLNVTSVPPAEPEPSLLAAIRTWIDSFLEPLSEFVDAFDEHFLTDAAKTAMTTTAPVFASMMALSKTSVLNLNGGDGADRGKVSFRAKLSAEQRAEVRKELGSVTDDLLLQFFDRCKRYIDIPGDIWSLNAPLAVRALESLCEEGSKYQSLNTVISLRTRVRGIAIDFFKKFGAAVFSRVRTDFVGVSSGLIEKSCFVVASIKAVADASLVERRSLAPKIAKSFATSLTARAFSSFRSFIQPDLQYFTGRCLNREEVTVLLTADFEEIFPGIKGDIQTYYELKHAENQPTPPNPVLLVAAKVFEDIASSHLEEIFSSFYDAVLVAPSRTKKPSEVPPSGNTASEATAAAKKAAALHIVTASGGSLPSNVSGGQNPTRREREKEQEKEKIDLKPKHREILEEWKSFAKEISAIYCLRVALPMTQAIKDYVRSHDLSEESDLKAADEAEGANASAPIIKTEDETGETTQPDFKSPERPGEAMEEVVDLFEYMEAEVSTVLTDEAVELRNYKRRYSAVSQPSRSQTFTPPTNTSSLAPGDKTIHRASTVATTGNSLATNILPRSSSARATIHGGGGLLSAANMFGMKRGISSVTEKSGVGSLSSSSAGSSVSLSNPLAPGPHSRSNSNAPASRSPNGLALDIGKLFVDKVDFYGPVPVSRCAILNAVARILLKTYCEELKYRLITLSRQKYQLVQVDAEYLRLSLVKPMFCVSEDESVLVTLAEELVATAERRSVDPVSLGEMEVARAAQWKVETPKLDFTSGSPSGVSPRSNRSRSPSTKSPRARKGGDSNGGGDGGDVFQLGDEDDDDDGLS
ncbi:Vacuolar protein sorting-associated protein 51 [Phlyctochytrium bullatum]|nr:Vacuolar protein sorting-associated protein 51 [Phlyctochytrium bullatum]